VRVLASNLLQLVICACVSTMKLITSFDDDIIMHNLFATFPEEISSSTSSSSPFQYGNNEQFNNSTSISKTFKIDIDQDEDGEEDFYDRFIHSSSSIEPNYTTNYHKFSFMEELAEASGQATTVQACCSPFNIIEEEHFPFGHPDPLFGKSSIKRLIVIALDF